MASHGSAKSNTAARLPRGVCLALASLQDVHFLSRCV